MEGEMKGEEAVEIFKLMKQQNMLPTKIEDLAPLSFIGQAAVTFYRAKIKVMDQLNMTEAQRKATLRDGQDAGEMLLDIESRIGELALKEEKSKGGRIPSKLPNGTFDGGTDKVIKSGKPPKHERLGLPAKRMAQSQTIHKHPEIVEKVKAKAKENEDIPTKTAVLSEIKYEKEKVRRKKAEGKKTESRVIVSIEQLQYIQALEQCIRILPQKPPKRWDPEPFKEATAYAKIITKRLEVFING